jgi:hypothetical protein
MKSTTLIIPITVAIALLLGLAPPGFAGPCILPNVGGTADIPPIGCEYVPPAGDKMQILPPAIPAGNTIDIVPTLKAFFNTTEVPGGSLGGHVQTYDAIIQWDITGTGGIFGVFARSIGMQVAVVTESGPRTPGDAVQSFDTSLVSIQGAIFGDPDFDDLSIIGGSNHGLPSPGFTKLTRLGPAGSDFQFDSFFDIAYTIDFQGAPGSILEGMDGPTSGTVRLETGDPIPEPASLMLLACGAAAILRRRRKT